jgi:hypothetical protein
MNAGTAADEWLPLAKLPPPPPARPPPVRGGDFLLEVTVVADAWWFPWPGAPARDVAASRA